MKKTLGIFCHGGGFRASYISGFLKCVEDNGIEIDSLVGVSAGFYTIFSHLAGVNDREQWTRNLDSPMYTSWSKFNLFREFVEFHTPKIVKKSPFTKEEILDRMKKCTAITTRFWGWDHDVLGDFQSIEEIKEVTLATGSIPWFLRSFPHKFRGQRYIDGGFRIKNVFDYLETDIRVVIVPTSIDGDLSDPGYTGSGRFMYVNDYPDRLRTFVSGEPEDYMLLWDKGYKDAIKFVEDLRKID